jgi:hypothetical protein
MKLGGGDDGDDAFNPSIPVHASLPFNTLPAMATTTTSRDHRRRRRCRRRRNPLI